MKEERNALALRYLRWCGEETPWRYDDKHMLREPPIFNLLTYVTKMAALREREIQGGEPMPEPLRLMYEQTAGFFLLQWYMVYYCAGGKHDFDSFLGLACQPWDTLDPKWADQKSKLREVIMWILIDGLKKVAPAIAGRKLRVLLAHVDIDAALRSAESAILGPCIVMTAPDGEVN